MADAKVRPIHTPDATGSPLGAQFNLATHFCLPFPSRASSRNGFFQATARPNRCRQHNRHEKISGSGNTLNACVVILLT